MKKKIDWKLVEKKAVEIITEQAVHAIPGEDKARAAVDQLAAWLDEQLTFHGVVGALAEALDGPVLQVLLRSFVQVTYERAVAEGLIEG